MALILPPVFLILVVTVWEVQDPGDSLIYESQKNDN